MDNDDSLNEKTFLQTMNIKLVHHHITKELIISLSFAISIIGIIVALLQYRYSRFNQQRMLKDMASLQKAEDQIQELQRELDKVKMEASVGTSTSSSNTDHQSSFSHHLTRSEVNHNHPDEQLSSKNDPTIENNLFNYYNNPLTISTVADSGLDYSRINELEEELRQTREQLNRAETALTNKSWAPPHQLQLWLQLTHELELNHYIAKRQAAENQLAAAKEGCEKLKKKRSSFFGSLRVAHGSSIDDVDNRILQAKRALSEITKELKERLNRWQQIEFLCGFPIIHNRGIVQIQAEIFNTNRNLPSPVELRRSTSEAYILDAENETLTLSKSPGISRYGFNQRSLRSNHSSDHKSSFSTSSTSASHQQHHHQHHNQHQSNQKSHHVQHNYLHSQLSRTEGNNDTPETSYLNESTADESSGSDLDIVSSTSHRHLNHPLNYQPQYYNSYQSPPPLPPPSNYNHDKVVFTLGDGVLDQESNLTEDTSFQPHHRRTWSSIRRAPRRSKKGKETKNVEVSKSYSLNTVEGKIDAVPSVEQQSQNGRRAHLDNHQPRKSSSRVSYGDTMEIKEATKQDTQIEPSSSTTDDDETEKSTKSTKIIENNGKDHSPPDPGENETTPPSPSTSSNHGKHSISTYIREARRSFKFMNHKRKRSSTDSTSKSAIDNQNVVGKNQAD